MVSFPPVSPPRPYTPPLSSPTRATCLAHLFLLHFITRTILGEEACPAATVSNPTAGLTLRGARNPFRGNSNYWQISQDEAGRIIPKRRLGNEKKVLRFKYAIWNVRGPGEKEEDNIKIPVITESKKRKKKLQDTTET